jgi:VIT1/CCC1 family predicted Fe2+/Mn2+ transporter
MRDDLTAAVGARRELGPDYEDAVLDGFLARLDRQMQERVDATVAERLSSGERRAAGAPAGRDPGLTLGIVSVIAGIPVTAITMGTEELAGLIVAWGGIAAVNVAQAWGRRRRNAGLNPGPSAPGTWPRGTARPCRRPYRRCSEA